MIAPAVHMATPGMWRVLKGRVHKLLHCPVDEDIPECSGVYFLFNGDRLDYIGISQKLCARIGPGHHVYKRGRHGVVVLPLPPNRCERLEYALIHALRPPKNIRDNPDSDRYFKRSAGVRPPDGMRDPDANPQPGDVWDFGPGRTAKNGNRYTPYSTETVVARFIRYEPGARTRFNRRGKVDLVRVQKITGKEDVYCVRYWTERRKKWKAAYVGVDTTKA